MTSAVPGGWQGDAGRELDIGATIMARLDELSAFSSDPEALTRLYLTPEHKAAALRVAEWMSRARMTVAMDAAGTVVGRYAGTGERTLIIGSHLDTVRNAGRYDGALGIVVAIQAVAAFAKRHQRLPFTIEIVAFGDEEGVRFPATLSGSRALAGNFDPATLSVVDENEVTLREALEAFGCNPALIPASARRPHDVIGYVEVHIEQGPVLEAEGLPLGIVTAISGATRLGIDVTGRAGHAGTVPMRLRQDALMAAAEMALAVERIAIDEPKLVATVGRMEVKPGAVNVIPGHAGFTVDIRSPDDGVRAHATEALKARFAAIAASRGVGLGCHVAYDVAAAQCAPVLADALAAAVDGENLRPLRLASGAGHDGLAMASLCPIGMLFVRCLGGISHNPAESITGEDAATAARALIRFLGNFQDLAIR